GSTGAAVDRVVANPSSSVVASSRSDQPTSPRPALGPAKRRRTVPTRAQPSSTAKPRPSQGPGSSATTSSSIVGPARIAPASLALAAAQDRPALDDLEGRSRN